jgi:hypothetical protein
MKTFADIINAWPSAEVFADDLRLRYRSHARVMKVRNSIPEKYWPDVVDAARRRGIASISMQMLESAAKARKSAA